MVGRRWVLQLLPRPNLRIGVRHFRLLAYPTAG